jgi:hypothetical protein
VGPRAAGRRDHRRAELSHSGPRRSPMSWAMASWRWARWRRLWATEAAPAAAIRAAAVFRMAAMTPGALPRLGRGRSWSQVRSRTEWIRFSTDRCPRAQTGPL